MQSQNARVNKKQERVEKEHAINDKINVESGGNHSESAIESHTNKAKCRHCSVSMVYCIDLV